MKKLLFLLFISTVCLQTFAVPAYPYPVTVTQPNGEELTLIMKGDEFINWAVTLDGYTLLLNSDRYFCYAQLNESGDMEPSDYFATEISNRSTEVNAWLQNVNINLFYSDKQVYQYMQLREIYEIESSKGVVETKGERKLLVILMEFPDRTYKRSVEDFEMLFNQVHYYETGFNGSLKDYFLEASYNTLTITSTITGPYFTKNNASYYTPDARWTLFAREAFEAVVDAGVDLAPFANGNIIPSFYAIYAGYDQSNGCNNCIWAHNQSNFNFPYGGYIVQKYSCSSELKGTNGNLISGIGTPCHEFGHALGAPDYYDTNYAIGGQYEGTGYWDLQASGAHNDGGSTPAHPNPRSKVYTYDWATVIELNTPQTVTVPLSRIYKNAFYRINVPHSDPGCSEQYFILENRTKAGFDAYIPGQNLLIYRCTENYNSSGNTTSWQRFYPVSANAPVAVPEAGVDKQKQYGNINSGSCPWPGNGNNTSFKNTSIPAMISWGGVPTNKPISNISVQGDYITFDFMGGGSKSNYHVFLPAYYGCLVTSESTSPVNTGGSFSFKVDLLPSHDKSNFVVTANNIPITPSENTYTINNIQADQIVRIEGIEFNTFPIKVTAGENGRITPDDNVNVIHGGIQTFDINADNGCSIVNVNVDGDDLGIIKSYTFKNVLEPHTIDASFKIGGQFNIDLSPYEIFFEAFGGTSSDIVEILVSSSDVPSNIAIAAPTKIEISLNGKNWYQAFSLSKSQLPATIYARFNPPLGSWMPVDGKITFKATEAYNEIDVHGTVLGIDEIDNNKNITIFPNPTTGKFQVMSDEVKISNIEIFDVYGKKQSYVLISNNQDEKMSIDISNLEAGIYIMTIQTYKGNIYKKLVKE
ncbi:MAG: M6 family metalloprotease domain-containing protein [Bacteroidales bacterium]|jgi:M6 family metalloprotease-like protein|nr:M6 family metalloprotease domain-containing protein [Bacteroidales bacterium]